MVDFGGSPHVEREMVLIKVRADAQTRPEVMNIVNIFRGKVIDAGKETFIIEITGDEGKIRAILELFEPLGIKEIVRTGKVALHRGTRVFGPLAQEGDGKAA